MLMNQAMDMNYFQSLKESPDIFDVCAQKLNENLNDEMTFYYLSAIEQVLSKKIKILSENDNLQIKTFLLNYLNHFQSSAYPKFFILNKYSQIFVIYFVNTYLNNVHSLLKELTNYVKKFYEDSTTIYQENSFLYIDIFLRILKALHSEIADRSLPSSQKDMHFKNLVKDKLRIEDIKIVISSLFQIIQLYAVNNTFIAVSALEVIALFSYWIDINLTINEDSFNLFLIILHDTSSFSEDVKIACLKTIQEILHKKMEPSTKIQFLETVFHNLLSNTQYPINLLYYEHESENLSIAKAKLINIIGTLSISTWTKLPVEETLKLPLLSLLENKNDLLMSYLFSNHIMISQNVIEFAEMITTTPQKLVINQHIDETSLTKFNSIVQKIYQGLVENLFLPTNVTAENLQQAWYKDFTETRLNFKPLFDNIGNIKFEMVLKSVHRFVSSSLPTWPRQTFRNLEMVLTLLNFFADFYNVYKSRMLSASVSNKLTNGTALEVGTKIASTSVTDIKSFAPILDDILSNFICCDIYKHESPEIQSLYFEVIAKFDRKISKMPLDRSKPIFIAFQNEHGILNPSTKLRSRCLQIFCRFIKNFKLNNTNNTANPNQMTSNQPGNFGNLSLETLAFIQSILDLAMSSTPLFTKDDLNALFESYANLVLSSNLEKQNQVGAIEKLVTVLIDKYKANLRYLHENVIAGQDILRFQTLTTQSTDLISYIIRTTKVFSTNFTMASMNLNGCYLNVLSTLVDSLNLWDSLFDAGSNAITQSNPEKVRDQMAQLKYLVYSNVRQYFHVMLVCLERDIDQFTIPSFLKFMSFKDIRNILDLLPLFNQISMKYKSSNFSNIFQHLFPPLISTVWELIVSDETSDRKSSKILNGSYDDPANTNTELCENIGAAQSPKSSVNLDDTNENRDRTTLRRAYYSLLTYLLNNQSNFTDMLIGLGDEKFQFVVQSVMQGITGEYDDILSQKSCFYIMRKFVDIFASPDISVKYPTLGPDLKQFIFLTVFPACLTAPLKLCFDFKDGQSLQALNECASCLQLIYLKGGQEFETLLKDQLFPSLNLDSKSTQEFLSNIKQDSKSFRNYLKDFYQRP